MLNLDFAVQSGKLMHLHTYWIVRDAYAAWRRGDIDGFGRLLAEDVEFSVPSSPRTYVGTAEGRSNLQSRLEAFLRAYEVIEFTILSAFPIHDSLDFRIQYHYRSRSTGLEIQGRQRHLWTVRDHAIVSFKVIHDAERLAAFFQMSEHPGDSPPI